MLKVRRITRPIVDINVNVCLTKLLDPFAAIPFKYTNLFAASLTAAIDGCFRHHVTIGLMKGVH